MEPRFFLNVGIQGMVCGGGKNCVQGYASAHVCPCMMFASCRQRESTIFQLTCAFPSSGSTSLLCSMAVSKDCRKSDTMGSTTFLLVLYFSWIIFSKPHFFTVPVRVSLFTKDERVGLFTLLAKGYSLMKLTQQPKRRGAFPSNTPGLVHRKRADVKHHAEPINETRSEQKGHCWASGHPSPLKAPQ